jgi:hypothetical protein
MDTTLWNINATPAAELGLRDFRLTLGNQVPDTLVFNADGLAFDAPALFSYGDSLSLYKGEVRWFEGVVLAGPRFGSPTMERHDYSSAGLWWYLDNLVFQQEWRVGEGSTLNKSHVILGRDLENDPVACGYVIKEALDYAIGLGAPFTYNTSDLSNLSAKPPPDEQVDLACSEVIRKMLRWIPDTVAWFDYAPATPVLRFTRRGAATAVQFDCTAGDPAEEIDISGRHDLQKEGVIISYERIDEIDGERIPALQQDIYPEGTTPGFNTASLTINIPGSSLATQSTEVYVLAGTAAATLKNVLIDMRPELAGAVWEDGHPYLGDGVRLANILVGGSVPRWTGKTYGQCQVVGKASWTDDNGSEHKKEEVSATLTLTNAESKTYTKELYYTPADPYPEGLAQALYNALATLHWQGRFQTIEEEVTGGIHPGHVLNLAGGLAAWATMRAAIQSVEYSIDDGRTLITFGPPEHLGPQDAIALLNANRTRITLYSGDARTTGKASGGEDIGVGGGTANSSASGNPRYSKLVLDDGAETPAKKITIDTSKIAAGKVLVCNEAGTEAEFADLVWIAGTSGEEDPEAPPEE